MPHPHHIQPPPLREGPVAVAELPARAGQREGSGQGRLVPKAKAKAVAKPQAKARARGVVSGCFGRPLAAPAGVQWKFSHYRTMWYRSCSSIAVRRTQGNRSQIGSIRCPGVDKLKAYEVAAEAITFLQGGVLEESDVSLYLASRLL